MIRFIFILFAMGAHICVGQYVNVKIAENPSSAIGPCEPSIAINWKKPNQLVAAALESVPRGEDGKAYTIKNRTFISNDNGKSWREKNMRSSFGDFGDPCLITDQDGYFYYFHLSDPERLGWKSNQLLDRIVCQRSYGGTRWSRGTSIGHNPPKKQDKPWAAFDAYSGRLFATWTQFDAYDSPNPEDSAHIMFSYSADRGKSFTPAVRINQYGGNCQDNDLTPEGAVPCAGPQGAVYVAWSYDHKIYFDRSPDGGHSWLKQDKVVAQQPGGWVFEIPGLGRANGMPVTACDMSYGPHHGTIYVNWADQRNGDDNTDIWLARSTDQGDTWSEPVRVNDDESSSPMGKHQFLSWMAVDQVTGIIYIIFYDRRHYDDEKTDVYLATSADGGITWKNEKISDEPFTPDSDTFFGDYTNIAAHAGVVRPIWTRMDNGKPGVWTALIDYR